MDEVIGVKKTLSLKAVLIALAFRLQFSPTSE